jgi:hypothetical protein
MQVVCFPISQIVSRVQPGIEGLGVSPSILPKRLASLLDVAISPDAFGPFPYSYQQV